MTGFYAHLKKKLLLLCCNECVTTCRNYWMIFRTQKKKLFFMNAKKVLINFPKVSMVTYFNIGNFLLTTNIKKNTKWSKKGKLLEPLYLIFFCKINQHGMLRVKKKKKQKGFFSLFSLRVNICVSLTTSLLYPTCKHKIVGSHKKIIFGVG